MVWKGSRLGYRPTSSTVLCARLSRPPSACSPARALTDVSPLGGGEVLAQAGTCSLGVPVLAPAACPWLVPPPGRWLTPRLSAAFGAASSAFAFTASLPQDAPGMPAKRGTCIAGVCGGLPGALFRWVWPAEPGLGVGAPGLGDGDAPRHGVGSQLAGAWRAACDAASPRIARAERAGCSPAVEAAAAVLESFRLGGAQEAQALAMGAGHSSEALLWQLLERTLAGQQAGNAHPGHRGPRRLNRNSA